MADSKTGTGNIQEGHGVSYNPESKEMHVHIHCTHTMKEVCQNLPPIWSFSGTTRKCTLPT